jgi:hypothetical protein
MMTADDIAFDGARVFRRVDEAHYRLTDELHGIELDADRLRYDRHELMGELSVHCSIKGAQTYNGLLSSGSFNFSSTQARDRHAGFLRARARTGDDFDWHALLEEFCLRIANAEREGQPAQLLRDFNRPSPGDTYEIAGLAFLKRHPQIIFGDGGTFKSYFGLYVAGTLAKQGVTVLYADWELAGEDHRDRLERLFGPDMPDVRYARCERPMVAEGERLRRLVDDLDAQFVICDSVAFACDGPPEAAEVAARYFRAVRQFGEHVGSLHIAHVTKPKDDEQKAMGVKPFGSVFWHNSARSTWYVKRADDTADSSRITIGVYNQKVNLGPLRPAVGLQIDFGAERTEVERIDLADVADLAAGLPLWRRISGVLKHGAQTIAAIGHELPGTKEDSIEKALKRGKGKTFTQITDTPDRIHRWALLERRVA